MPRLALAYKSSFKMNPAALCAQTKAENIPAMHWSTLLLAQRACWDRAAQPSPDAGPQPTGPDLKSVTSAYMCLSMHTMWSGSDNNMCIWNHIHALCLFPLLILGAAADTLRFECSARLHLLPSRTNRLAAHSACLSCAQVTELTDPAHRHTCFDSHTDYSSRALPHLKL